MIGTLMGICIFVTQEQVHDIEEVFFKHIEENFKHIKASHGDSCKEKEE